jgi:hypothetical protein
MTTNPDAFWVADVGAESGLKLTSKASFDPVTLVAAEIAGGTPRTGARSCVSRFSASP